LNTKTTQSDLSLFVLLGHLTSRAEGVEDSFRSFWKNCESEC